MKDPNEIESDIMAEEEAGPTDTEDQPKKTKPRPVTIVASKRKRASAVNTGGAAVANSRPSRKFSGLTMQVENF